MLFFKICDYIPLICAISQQTYTIYSIFNRLYTI
nr:MAG TPA: hypothetical protein [Caudoviricetes sp.]